MSPLLRSSTQKSSRQVGLAAVGCVLAAAVSQAGAQTEGGQELSSAGGSRRAIAIVPRISVTETLTDNIRLSSVNKQSEQTTDFNPGIRISGESSRVKGYFDYSRHESFYAQNSSGRTSQNALNTFGSIEAIDNRAYLDFSGTISQQAISALGTQSVGNSAVNANLTESTNLRLSPHLRGQLGGFANYTLRYSISTNRSQSAQVSDVTTTDAQLQLQSTGSSAPFAWSIAATRQNIGYSGIGRSTESNSVTGSLIYTVTPQLRLTLTGGQESNNFTTVNKESNGTSGFAVNWRPSETTQFNATRQNRSFGDSFNISLDHRTGRTAWRFSDSRDVSTTPSQPGFASLGSTYDLYFAQFAAIEPDPISRAALVSNFLLVNGINPNTVAISSFLTSAVSLQRRQDLSIALLGVRDTITLTATRSEGSRLDSISGVSDDLSNAGVVRQSGLSVNFSHKLTPETALTLLASAQQASSSLGQQETTTNLINVSVSTRLGSHTSALLGLRRVMFESNTNPYTETAVTGTLNVAF